VIFGGTNFAEVTGDQIFAKKTREVPQWEFAIVKSRSSKYMGGSGTRRNWGSRPEVDKQFNPKRGRVV